MQGHPRWMDHSKEFWQNVGHWRTKWQLTPVFLPEESHVQSEKAKINDTKYPPRSEDVQYAIGGGQLLIAPVRMEVAGPKQEWCSAVEVSGGKSKVQCCKEQYWIGTWNVRSTNQRNLDVVKQEMARVNINILGISELKRMGMGDFNSDDHYIYYCGQESLRRNGVVLTVKKRIRNAVFAICYVISVMSNILRLYGL